MYKDVDGPKRLFLSAKAAPLELPGVIWFVETRTEEASRNVSNKS